LYNEHRVSFLGVKWPVYGVDHPPPFSAEVVEERTDRAIAPFPLWAFMACSRVKFTF